MSKIVTAANAMIANPKKISPVLLGRNESEIFFTYDGKYNWSMTNSGEKFSLFFYPIGSTYSLQDLSNIDDSDWESVSLIRYSSTDIGTEEAKQTFAELYTLLKEKVYGVNDALDDIIGDLF